MSQNTDRLTTMAKVAPDQVGQIEGSIAQVESSIDSLGKEASAITDGVCGGAETDMTTYLDGPKLTALQVIWPEVPGTLGPLYIVYGGTYGLIDYTTGNITDWEYRQDNLVPIPPVPPEVVPGPPDPEYYVRYVFTPGDDSMIDGWNDDYSFGNDYLTRPLDTGASYGLLPKIGSLQNAANLLNENADKIGDSVAVFNKYKT